MDAIRTIFELVCMARRLARRGRSSGATIVHLVIIISLALARRIYVVEWS
jgi:hypothetical protein